ncbi:unnamed protein product [Colias eurytheme]|nr:unnamed protein product [Colias eurytheme]
MLRMTRLLMAVIVGIIFFNNTACAYKQCPPEVLKSLPYIVDHAVWRSWNQAIIFTPKIETGCQRAILHLVKCLAINGVASALNVRSIPRVHINIGVIILSPHMVQNTTSDLTKLINQLNGWKLNHASADWLISVRSVIDFKQINNVLNVTDLRFDQNILVSYYYNTARSAGKLNLCKDNFIYHKFPRSNNVNDANRKYNNTCLNEHNQTYNCIYNEFEKNYYRTSKRFNIARNKILKRNGTAIRLLQSGNVGVDYTRTFKVLNVSGMSLQGFIKLWRGARYPKQQGIHVLQYFKIRLNSTLYASYLGHWDGQQSMALMEMPYPVEARNFMGETLIVGRRNCSVDDNSALDEENTSAPELLNDLLFFLTVKMNGTSLTRYYSKLGFRTYEGVWSGLLGALLDRSVDIALEPVTDQPSRQQDMDFIFPIAETMYNIYIRNQETSSVRDIFLAPFSPRLIICVVAVVVIAAIAIVLVCKLSNNNPKKKSHKMSCTEALIWSTGILCQQGGTQTPSNPAASILLIVCLFFAVVTYNAYAAFITSVLSVRVANVGTVADVLQSPNMKIGYIRNGADQTYLMSTKDVQLNAFYIRGYSEAENLVSSAEEGLARAASQDYAFFAEQRSARSTLTSLSQARGRCALRELPVHSTRSQLSFPLPRRSPYSKPILVSLLQLRSSGTLSKLAATLVPAMPECAPPSGFASARAADVRTAFLVIITGLIAALLVGIGEYCWKNRKQNRIALKKFYYRFWNLLW